MPMRQVTPAAHASAYHRRRHVLKTNATQLRPPRKPSVGATNPPLPPDISSSKQQSPQRRRSPRWHWQRLRTRLPNAPAPLRAAALTLFAMLSTMLLRASLSFIPFSSFFASRCRPTPSSITRAIAAIALRGLAFPPCVLTLCARSGLGRVPHIPRAAAHALLGAAHAALFALVAMHVTPLAPALGAECLRAPTPLLPAWQDLAPVLLVAALASPAFAFLAPLVTPLPRGFPPAPTVVARRFILLASLPTVVAAFPAVMLTAFAIPHGYYAWLRALRAVVIAGFSTFLSLLTTALHAVPSPNASPQTDPLHARDRLVMLLQNQQQPQNQQQHASPDALLSELVTLTATEEPLHAFPGFADPSGIAWRTALTACLQPLAVVRDALARRAHPSPLFAAAAAIPNNPTRAPVVHIDVVHVQRALDACGVLARVYEACQDADTFGVVHPTLPFALADLLRCKAETATFVAEGHEEFAHGWRRALGVASVNDLAHAVDDALSCCIYRIVSAFRPHLPSYLRGAEVDWDRQLNGMLSAFLEYQVP